VTCPDCHAEITDRYDHVCLDIDLPGCLVATDGWAIRETASGRGLWKSYMDGGRKVSYRIGATAGADLDALRRAVDTAEEELASLWAEFKAYG
jgi:hypothetical protein